VPEDAQHRIPPRRSGGGALSARYRPGSGGAARPGNAAEGEQVGRELGLTVVNMRFVKPLDRALVLELAASHEGLVSIEDNVVAGGAGSGVAELLAAEGLALPMLHLGLPDAWQEHASREQLLAEAGIDADGIRRAVLARWPDLGSGRAAATA
jgi:1-deoxy-D-xylulose-5-phosphate synthase